jgi:hypothetical protein
LTSVSAASVGLISTSKPSIDTPQLRRLISAKGLTGRMGKCAIYLSNCPSSEENPTAIPRKTLRLTKLSSIIGLNKRHEGPQAGPVTPRSLSSSSPLVLQRRVALGLPVFPQPPTGCDQESTQPVQRTIRQTLCETKVGVVTRIGETARRTASQRQGGSLCGWPYHRSRWITTANGFRRCLREGERTSRSG